MQRLVSTWLLLPMALPSLQHRPFAEAAQNARNDWKNNGGNWFSLTPQVEVQWGKAKDPQHAQRLEMLQRRFLQSGNAAEDSPSKTSAETMKTGMSSPFLNGNEVYYDDYSQAWRLLGFYMDCNDNMAYLNGDDDDDRRDMRQLSEDDGQKSCMRYLLWAAYVDLDHEGDGLYEYIMWDPKNDEWNVDGCRYDPDSITDDEARQNYEDNYRCVKMDCHEEDTTHFELLGIFKEPGPEDWFEQLFKHEGNCVWTEDEYNFMQTYREVWPEECTQIGDDEDGNGLYYHIKPIENGLMDIGIYTDKYCSVDYTGEYERDNLLNGLLTAEYYYCANDDDANNNNYNYNYNNGDLDLLQNIDKWNELLSIYTLCQPCVAYTPAWMKSYQNGNYNNRQRRASSDEEFECEDDAGYNNVNQCMKFATHTDMMVARTSDVMTAVRQGSLASIPNDLISMSARQRSQLRQVPRTFWYALAYFVVATLLYLKALQVRARVRRQKNMKQPLVEKTKRRKKKRSKGGNVGVDNGGVMA